MQVSPIRLWIYDSAGVPFNTSYVETIPGSGSIGTHPEFASIRYFWIRVTHRRQLDAIAPLRT